MAKKPSSPAATLGHGGGGRSSPLRSRELPSPHLLRLHHLHQIASWASASIPPLGAFLGSHLASTCESLGCPPPPSPYFTCERCESILQVGLNCSVRVRKTVSKKRKGTAPKSVNSVIYFCHFCSFANVKPGTKKAYVKTKLTEVAARDKLSELAQGVSFETPQSSKLDNRSKTNQCPGSSGKKTKRKGWVSLKELTASTIVLSPPASVGAQRPTTPALKPVEQLHAFQPKLPESLLRATSMLAKKQLHSLASVSGTEGENISRLKSDFEQKPVMSNVLTIGHSANWHPDDTIHTSSGSEEKAGVTASAIALSEHLEQVESFADQDTLFEIDGTSHHNCRVASQQSELVQSRNDHASCADSLDRHKGDIEADLVLVDDVPHEVGEQVETTIDRAGGTWIAGLTGLQGQEVASTIECDTSFVQTPISHEAHDLDKEMKDTDNTLQLLYNDQQQYIGDISNCPMSKLGLVSELVNVNEIGESNVKELSRGMCNCDSENFENQSTNHHHDCDSKVAADGPSKALSTSNIKPDILLSNGIDNIVLCSSGLSLVLQDSVPSDLRMSTQDQENNRVSGYVDPHQARIRLSDAGVQCSILESKHCTIMQTQDRSMNQGIVDQGKSLSAVASKDTLPFEEKTDQVLHLNLQQTRVNDPSIAERQHSDSVYELETVRRQKHERCSSHKRLVASYRSLKQELLVIPSLRKEICRLSDQLVEVTKVVDQLANRLAEVSCPDLNGKQGSTATPLFDLFDGTDARAKHVLKNEDIKVNTLPEAENKLCCAKDSDGLQTSLVNRFSSRKRMRLQEMGIAATDDPAADGSITQQLAECLPKGNYVGDVQKEKEISNGMLLQVPSLEFRDRNSTKSGNKQMRDDDKHTRRKKPVLMRFGRQWFTISKPYKRFKWRIV